MRELPVAPDLAAYVRAVRVHDAAAGLPVETHTVVPGPFPVLGCRWRGSLSIVNAGRGDDVLGRSGLTGLQSGATRYRSQADTRTVLVYLRPEAASALFGVGGDALLDGETPLDGLVATGLAREMEERTALAASDAEAGAVVERLLRDAIRRARRPVHASVQAAVSAILDARGGVRIEDVAARANVGRRQLERLFQAHVGVSPKRLASLARFGWAASRIRSGRPWTRVALDAGYADQAHFIRSFSSFTGASPARFLAGWPDGDASHFFNTQP